MTERDGRPPEVRRGETQPSFARPAAPGGSAGPRGATGGSAGRPRSPAATRPTAGARPGDTAWSRPTGPGRATAASDSGQAPARPASPAARPAPSRRRAQQPAARRTVEHRHPAGPPRRSPGGRPPRIPRAGAALGSPARRLRVVLVLLAVGLLVLGLRLVQIQGLNGERYLAKASSQRTHETTLSATRGAIVDRNGTPLALSVDVDRIIGDQRNATGIAATAAALAPLIGRSAADIRADLTTAPRSQPDRYVVLADNVPVDVGRRIVALGLPGITAEHSTARQYPGGTYAANLIGFVNGSGQGASGVELAANSLLAGKDGHLTAQYGALGGQIPGASSEVAAVDGSSVQLTIDADLQYQAEQMIAKRVQETTADSGYLLAMDPRTGEILAMATAPTFDASHPGASDKGNLGNRVALDVYEPGSVNKVITFAAALQEGVINPTTPIVVPPTISKAGSTFHDAESHGTLNLTATGVLAHSSNIGTIEIAAQLGRQKLYDYLTAFGFGAPTGYLAPLKGPESSGTLPPPSQWSGSQAWTIPWGQGVGATAIQMASVYQAVANHGLRVQPTLVKSIVGPDGRVTATPTPATRQVISPQNADTLRDMMESVVTDQGTARNAEIAGYTVAGKTGTAQKAGGACNCYAAGEYTASFIGFAPADNPQLLVEVVLQNPHTWYAGGSAAAPVFHDFASYALAERRIAPTGVPAVNYPLTFG